MTTRIDDAERRRRLGRRHHLAAPAPDVLTATDGVGALHATDPATVYLAVAARTRTVLPHDIERALYDSRRLVKVLGMRRTVFVLPLDAASEAFAACTTVIALRERRQLVKHLRETGGQTGDVEGWLAGVEEATVAALEAAGEATGTELADAVEGLRVEVDPMPGKPYGGMGRITTRVLTVLAAQGRIVRGRPTGGLTSTRYRWAPLRAWLPDGLVPLPPKTARTALARRYLARFGPATLEDVQWWTGWTKTEARAAVAACDAREVTLAEGTGYVLPHDLDPTPPGPGWIALLPALDPTAMGWKRRDWYLGPHRDALFDRNGNVGPTVWCDGRIVGGWAQRADGTLGVRLLEPVDATATEAIEAEAARLATWLGPVRVIPRFRTPLERAIVG